MKADTDPEENAFELDGLVIKTKAAGGKAPSRKAVKRRKAELFARITERHCMLLADTGRMSSVILFLHLMMYSVKAYSHPFSLPIEDLAKETGMARRQQMRAVRDLVRIEIIRTEGGGRGRHSSAPLIIIPGTTKPGRKTT